MIVLQHGNTYKEIKCNKCEALLGFTNSDIETWEDYYISEETHMKHYCVLKYIKCLECNNTIILYQQMDERILKDELFWNN